MTITTTHRDAARKNAVDLANQLVAEQATYDRLAAESQAAATKVETIEASFEHGDADTFTAEDLAAAESEAKRSSALTEAACKRVASLAKAQVNTDLQVAEALASVVSELFKGRVPVEVRIGKPPKTEDADTLPLVVLTQADAGKSDGGILSGKAQVSYVRDELHSPLDAQRLEEVARARGFVVQVSPQHVSRERGTQIDHAIVGVHRAWLDLPVIEPAPDDDAARYWAQGIMSQLVRAVARSDRPMVMLGERIDNSSGTVQSASVESCVSEGTRTSTVTATIRVRPYTTDGQPVKPRLARVLDGQTGSAETGLGKLTSLDADLELEGSAADGFGRGTWNVTLTGAFVSAA